MSGAPRVRSTNVAESEARPVLGPAGNKARSVATARKPASKPSRKVERAEVTSRDGKKSPNPAVDSPPLSPSLSAPSISRRQDLLLQSNLSLNASCSSDCSTDSYCSRASTGRIGGPRPASRRKPVMPKPEKIVAKLEKLVSDDTSMSTPENFKGKRKCAWVTPNIGALAELAWPAILSKRHIFREVFMDFDPVAVSKMNEKKIVAPGSTAGSLLSEPKLRAITENARQILKIIGEFGSFDRYCWSFVNHKPIVNRFRYPRQVPVKTPKADSISKDLVRRGFRCVGPTVVYSFMQVAGITNDHLINCYRFDECCAASIGGVPEKEANGLSNHKVEEESTLTSSMLTTEQDMGIDLGLARGMNGLLNHKVEEESTLTSSMLTTEQDMGIDLGLARGMNGLLNHKVEEESTLTSSMLTTEQGMGIDLGLARGVNGLANHKVEEKSTRTNNMLTTEQGMGINLGLARGVNGLAIS